MTDQEARAAALVSLCALCVVIPYIYIGLNRLLHGGVHIFSGEALVYYLAGTSRGFAAYPAWLPIEPAMAAFKAGFAVVTALEISSGLVLYSARFRQVWLVAMTAFHLSTVPLMNILFWENLMLAAVLFWWGWKPSPQPSPRHERASAQVAEV